MHWPPIASSDTTPPPADLLLLLFKAFLFFVGNCILWLLAFVSAVAFLTAITVLTNHIHSHIQCCPAGSSIIPASNYAQ